MDSLFSTCMPSHIELECWRNKQEIAKKLKHLQLSLVDVHLCKGIQEYTRVDTIDIGQGSDIPCITGLVKFSISVLF